jgi:hypothetical protein
MNLSAVLVDVGQSMAAKKERRAVVYRKYAMASSAEVEAIERRRGQVVDLDAGLKRAGLFTRGAASTR